VVADVLSIRPDMVHVKPGFDSEHNVYTGHTGTYASQFAVTGLSALHGAATKLKAEMSRLAAFVLKADEKTWNSVRALRGRKCASKTRIAPSTTGALQTSST
jgi:CO/xanthine dehydrogenase Mo-binding subunit